MASEPNALTQISAIFTPIHRDGYKFVGLAALVTILAFLLSSVLGLIGVVITVAMASFFRDPERVTPTREGLVIAPADGNVIRTENVAPPPELGLGSEPMTCLSIFLSLWDVHVIRAPVGGRIEASVHRDGVYHNAETSDAQRENERQGFIIETKGGVKTGVVLIAGYAARRIVTVVKPGDQIAAGERIGLIRFGSRVDVYLPPHHPFLTASGQRMIAGETVIADLESQELPRIFKRG
jgi:phosphatidylserine decarboxylase